jgi:1-acyl-sn-glycerol-3-phosphate acyltransferase
LTALMPNTGLAWRVGHAGARWLLRLTGTPFEVHGIDKLPRGPCVLVSNHGSYLDGVLLVAALSRPFAFVAKRELRDQFVPRVYLQRIGAEYVERFEAQRSVADTSRLADAVTQGKSLLVFPEGTFVARPELLPFHLGAFVTAARAGVPVVPVALRGTRDLLPDGAWWPRRAPLGVTVCEPVMPPAETIDIFAAAVRLRDAARRAITLHSDHA